MTSKNLIAIIVLFVFYGCSCSDDEVVNFDLNSFESSAMPPEPQTNVQFVNAEQELFNADISAKLIEKQSLEPSSDEKCLVIVLESHENKLVFESIQKTYTTYIEKRSGNKSSIVAFDGTLFYGIDNLDTENLEEELIDTTQNGFDFNNVFVLNSGGDSGLIIYSPTKGIVFIKNDDGTFFMRTE